MKIDFKRIIAWIAVSAISYLGMRYIGWPLLFYASLPAYELAVSILLFAVTVAFWIGPAMKHIIEPQEGDSRKTLTGLAYVVLLTMGLVFFYGVTRDWDEKKLGTLGDFLGGTLNPLLTFLTFVGLILTIILQQREVHAAKVDAAALEIERKADRSRASRHEFETMFFQMLSVHNSIVNSMDLRSQPDPESPGNGKEWHGRDCFARFYYHLEQEHEKARRGGSLDPVADGYDAFWKRDRKDLGHYYRFLFNMIRLIDDSEFDKKAYMRLVRAQLSDYELLVLFYNAMNPKGQAFKTYITKYSLFDNLPDELLLDTIHLDYYPDDAYFDKSVKREDPEAFLDGWRATHIYAERRTPEEYKFVREELYADARAAGITRPKLERAAGNELEVYLREALEEASRAPAGTPVVSPSSA
ncbi:putative membrane protein [Rhizobium tibeticum]|uniref:putative phage abortive infection protein n=1 Tax=Rhizobium tibeticum TaxID=501024 RepID=UPI002783B3AC|nr:putative phage abortive infection protein [Rhizobium tibeticum]MDP9808307.1 putative membrane protein [Rhizobium tibeticum]